MREKGEWNDPCILKAFCLADQDLEMRNGHVKQQSVEKGLLNPGCGPRPLQNHNHLKLVSGNEAGSFDDVLVPDFQSHHVNGIFHAHGDRFLCDEHVPLSVCGLQIFHYPSPHDDGGAPSHG